jgi:hypothetical protein
MDTTTGAGRLAARSRGIVPPTAHHKTCRAGAARTVRGA